MGGWVELMSSLGFKADIQEQHEKSAGSQENGVCHSGVLQQRVARHSQDLTCCD